MLDNARNKSDDDDVVRFAFGDNWRILLGSILHIPHINGLGTFDIIHSRGVLHHTGQMHQAIRNAATRVTPGATAVFASLLKSRSSRSYVDNYACRRGVDYLSDVRDWVGGYPYESARPSEVDRLMGELAFEHVRSFVNPLSGGLFGSGCDEYVFRRTMSGAPDVQSMRGFQRS